MLVLSRLLAVSVCDASAHEHAHDGRHHQTSCPAARVAEAMETIDVRVEVFVHLDAVGVELELGGVEQRLLRGEAGHDVVDSLDEVDYVEHRAVGHGGGYVARDGVGESGSDIRAVKLLLPCALSVEDIAVALDENMSRAEHVCQLADLLCVFDRLVERLIEVVGAEYREIRVVALELFV